METVERKYKPIVLSDAESRLTERLKAHVRQMFPIAQPGGHDYQHVLSQLDLWLHVGGSVMEEFDSVFDPFLPALYVPGHDLNRLPIFEDWAPKFFKMETKDLEGEALERAEAHNARLAADNQLVEERMVAMYDGLLRHLKAPDDLRERVLKLMVEIGGPNKPEDPADLIVCVDLDKIPGPFYAWRCAAVGAGHRIRHRHKRYLIATPPEENRHQVADEELESWIDDLRWAQDWDHATAPYPQKFVIRSEVLREIAAPDFVQLRQLIDDTLAQLKLIGYRL